MRLMTEKYCRTELCDDNLYQSSIELYQYAANCYH